MKNTCAHCDKEIDYYESICPHCGFSDWGEEDYPDYEKDYSDDYIGPEERFNNKVITGGIILLWVFIIGGLVYEYLSR